MRRVALLLSVALVFAAAFSLHASAGASQSSRIIDRTLLCSTIGQAGVRKIVVSALSPAPGQKDPVTGERIQAAAGVWTGPPGMSSGGRRSYGGASLASVKTRVAEPDDSTLSINADACRPSGVRVPLSARGLTGGAAGPFGDSFECFTGTRVLVRVRVVFRSPARLRLDSRFIPRMRKAREAVREGALAVRTRAGKPLAFASAFDSGRARVFAASSCVPE
jgi:hypothetical protein